MNILVDGKVDRDIGVGNGYYFLDKRQIGKWNVSIGHLVENTA